ncbi:hypothetical protein EVAR_87112_1 [Eumeta japonica]|uniref:Uncharacterized protein n=1 Tax=Eumeta variegata TaxID=151549 RepID=A0A4C1ZWF3_EUMVA|nr:hypothetical protein EVAR_87112_1 [Eumeta japonica]
MTLGYDIIKRLRNRLLRVLAHVRSRSDAVALAYNSRTSHLNVSLILSSAAGGARSFAGMTCAFFPGLDPDKRSSRFLKRLRLENSDFEPHARFRIEAANDQSPMLIAPKIALGLTSSLRVSFY